MRVEFIGLAGTADQTELITRVGPAVEPDFLYRLAVAHEQSGDPLADAVAHASVIRLVHERVGEDVEGYRARTAA